MPHTNYLLPLTAAVVVLNIIPLVLMRKRIAYRNYYFSILISAAVFLLFTSGITWALFLGQFIFLICLSFRNLFCPLDPAFNFTSRLVATLGLAALILLLILHKMASGPFAFG